MIIDHWPVLLCYLDESGDEQALRTATDPPVLVIAGLVVDHQRVHGLVYNFLQLKKKFRPMLAQPTVQLSDLITHEIKGSDLRKDIRNGGRNARRAVYALLNDTLDLLEECNAKIVGEIHIKGTEPLARWVYAVTVARVAEQLEAQSRAANTSGAIVLDARTKSKNVPSVHRITTERFRAGGNPYPRLVESPVFGHSDAHVALQVADLLASALLFPMACFAYSQGLIDNIHLTESYGELRDRFGSRLRLLEHRYAGTNGRHAGGIVVRDNLNNQRSMMLYKDCPFDTERRDSLERRRSSVSGSASAMA
ncbi:DUF3800 domain-containing protein [Nocardia higoensis]|uniref:DUF3800 domain-containing protein n=1 Tax=Nocardia higoensis TaxID=228599 RepID=UPI0012F6F43F|nr:DUF3800 domain-containing protein [Nocardia higoensis]